MASSGRRTDPSVEESLFERGYEFEFFQAVRLLGWLFPDRKHVGGAAKPSEEVARFAARLSLAFPPSAVHDIEHTPDSPDPARMTVAFLALTGTQGVLPLHYTEFLLAPKSRQGRYARGVPRSVQPPAGVAVLPGVGEAPSDGSV